MCMYEENENEWREWRGEPPAWALLLLEDAVDDVGAMRIFQRQRQWRKNVDRWRKDEAQMKSTWRTLEFSSLEWKEITLHAGITSSFCENSLPGRDPQVEYI